MWTGARCKPSSEAKPRRSSGSEDRERLANRSYLTVESNSSEGMTAVVCTGRDKELLSLVRIAKL
jgi:hypothetical protein